MTRSDGDGEALGRVLYHLNRLHLEPDYAVTHLVIALREAPRMALVHLSEEQRLSALANGAITEEDIHAAERSIADGDFIVDLLGQVIIRLTSCLMDTDLKGLLNVDQDALDRLYDTHDLVGRSLGKATGTPAWLIDTSTEDGLIAHHREILRADAPHYAASFGLSLYAPHAALRAYAPLTPYRWLSQLRPATSVTSMIETVVKKP